MPPVPKSRGRTSRRFKTMARTVRARCEPCCYCGLAIDLTLPQTDRRSFTVAHWLPVATHPHLAEEWDNIRGSAHKACNSSAGVDNEPPQLGLTSCAW